MADPCHRASFYSEGDKTWTYYCVLDAGHDAALDDDGDVVVPHDYQLGAGQTPPVDGSS